MIKTIKGFKLKLKGNKISLLTSATGLDSALLYALQLAFKP